MDVHVHVGVLAGDFAGALRAAVLVEGLRAVVWVRLLRRLAPAEVFCSARVHGGHVHNDYNYE